MREATGYYWVWPEQYFPGDSGRSPSKHPFVPCEIKVCDAKKLATGWTAAWLPVDEVYCNLAEGEPVELLATTDLDGVEQPIAWRNRNRPNLTAWVPGHRPDIWELPVMRDGLSAVIDLAVNGTPGDR